MGDGFAFFALFVETFHLNFNIAKSSPFSFVCTALCINYQNISCTYGAVGQRGGGTLFLPLFFFCAESTFLALLLRDLGRPLCPQGGPPMVRPPGPKQLPPEERFKTGGDRTASRHLCEEMQPRLTGPIFLFNCWFDTSSATSVVARFTIFNRWHISRRRI